MASKKKLVILGAGLGGFPLALHIEKDKKLSALFDVVLVDKKEFFEMNLASVRFLVKDNIHHQVRFPSLLLFLSLVSFFFLSISDTTSTSFSHSLIISNSCNSMQHPMPIT